MYEYLFWTILLGVGWAIAYFTKPGLRHKILWSSLVALPFGIGEIYFNPNYWNPQTLFNLGARYGVDIESFALMFFLGGTAGYAYELTKKRAPLRQKICNPLCRCYISLIATLATFTILTKILPDWNIIYPSILACLAGGITALAIYPQMRNHGIFGGIIFAVLYWVSLVVTDMVFTGWIANTWNMSMLTGITFFRVPLEEILFGFSFGTIWSPLYEEVCSNLKVHT